MKRPTVIVVLSVIVAVSLLGWWLVSCYPTYKSVPRLVKELRDENPNIRKQAAAELGLMGEDAKDAAPALIEVLDDPIFLVRIAVADALGEIAGEPGVIPALASALDGEKRSMKMILLESLSKAGPEPEVTAAFIKALNYDDDSIRNWALALLRDFGPDASDAIPVLIEKFNDQDDSLRVEILNTLAAMGPEPEIIETMIDSIGDENHEVRIAGVTHLGNFGNVSRSAVPLLLDILNDKTGDNQLRAETVVALGKIGPEPGVADAVLAATWDESLQVYKGAFDSLGNLGDAPEVIHALIEIVRTGDTQRQINAVYALGKIGPKAESALPMLVEKSGEGTVNFRRAVIFALGEISPTSEIVLVLTAALQDESMDIRRAAAEAAGKVGPGAADAAPFLISNLDGGDWLRAFSATALNRIDAGNYDITIPVLIDLLDRVEPPLVAVAAVELGTIGLPALDALPKLEQLLSKTNLKRNRGNLDTPPSGFESRIGGVPYSRKFVACAYAVARIDPGNERALYVLIQGLGDNYWELRNYAIIALGELGAQAKPALPYLDEITGDYSISPGVREAAESAIDRINADDSTPLQERLSQNW